MSLPPDPDSMNDQRAASAEKALFAFIMETGCDPGDEAIGDLLCNLMHLCDRLGVSFDTNLARAFDHYFSETQPDGATA